MSFSLILPAMLAAAFGVAAGLVRWPLRPRFAMRLLSGIAAVSATTVFVLLVAGAVGLLGRWALVVSLVEWCPVVPLHHEIGYLEGSLVTAALIAVVVRMRRVLRRRHWASSGTEGRRLSVLETAEPIAYAAPGDPGCVVISRGLLNVLAPSERQVVFAHERAHLTQNHHRYLLVGELALSILPVLRPLVDQLRLATERCADEAAAIAVGGNRTLVARTIAKAAVSTASYPRLAGAFGGGSIPARVRALLDPPPSRARVGAASVVVAVAAGLALTAGSVQMHHLVELAAHLCHV